MTDTSDAIRVLHVDDEPDLADMVAAFLEREDDRIIVRAATSARDGLDLLAGHEVDCIVSDHDMPGQNGIEFLRVVREEYPNLPFILYTGKGSEEVASDAISAGVTDYLQKESNTDQYAVLANRIANAVEAQRSQRERRRQLDAIESAQEGISILDEDGHFLYVNELYAELYGYDPREMIDEHWGLIYRSGDVEGIHEDILPTVEETGYWHGTTTGLRADGSTFVEDHVLTRTDHGELVCTVRDITDRRERERELEETRARFQALTTNTSHAVVTIDGDSTVQYANDAVEDVLGYAPEELVDESLLTIMPERFRAVHREAIDRYLRDGTERLDRDWIEFPGLHRDGGEVPLGISLGEASVEGEPRFTALVRDITEQKERERGLERTRDLLERTERTADVGGRESLVRHAVDHDGEDALVTVGELDDGFYIEDDGFGIPPDDREGASQADDSVSRVGTGVGLSIVEQIAESHGWDIRVTEGTDGGVRFEITGDEFATE